MIVDFNFIMVFFKRFLIFFSKIDYKKKFFFLLICIIKLDVGLYEKDILVVLIKMFS